MYNRRSFIAKIIQVAVLAVTTSASASMAQDWPTRPIRIYVGFGAGGGTDIATRIIGEPLGELLGQRIVVENKPGAGGSVAADYVAKSTPDGYTALMISSGHTTSAVMLKTLQYDPVNDFSYVGIIAQSSFAVVAPNDLPANDIKGLIALIKKDPGKLNYSTVGLGSTQHLSAETMLQLTGAKAQHVPYRTTPEVVTALLRGESQFAVELAHAVQGQVKAGQLKILAVTNAQRWPLIPDAPTIAESGVPGFSVFGWNGLVFPRGTPQPIIDKVYKALTEVMSRDQVKKQLEAVGAIASLSTPEQFRKQVQDEIAKWKATAERG